MGRARMSATRGATDVSVTPAAGQVAGDRAVSTRERAGAGASASGSEQPRLAVAALPVSAALVVLSFATFPLDRALIAAGFSAVLVVLSAIDIERGIIPNRIVLPATGVILIARLALFPDHAAEWVLAPLAVAGVLAIPALLGRNWMGMGDIKMMFMVGAFLGWRLAALTIFIGVFSGSLAGIALMFRRGRRNLQMMLPFGIFLGIGAVASLLAGTRIIAWYFSQFK